jgi:hypothetical protein
MQQNAPNNIIVNGNGNFTASDIEDGMGSVVGSCGDSFRYIYTPTT